ncbi:MAG: hypothetical protein FK730_09770 [Asgard group archaeon]|nr:hypothetical protein [Asgard group archaeon]
MSEDETKKPIRLNQWFVRGIGFIITGLFVLIMALTLLNLDQVLFSNDLLSTIDFDYTILAKEIGNYLWTFRVYDLLLVVILIILASIASYYIVNYKSIVKTKSRMQLRREQF